MQENKPKEEEENKKPLNIVLLGESCSEKEKLIKKYLLSNSPQSTDIDIKKEEEKEEDKSILQNIIYSVEMNGEKIKMKIWDNPSREEFLSPSIKIAQGILLFYSIKNHSSFEKIKEDLSKIIQMGKFDIPIVVIGNHCDSTFREVSYEEAKSFADSYALRFYETSIDNGGTIKQILQDIGEQLLFKECINTANNSKILDNENDILNSDENITDINLEFDDLNDNLNIGELIKSKNKPNYKSAKSSKESNNSLNNTNKNDKTNSLTDSNIKKMKSSKQVSNFTLHISNSTTNVKKGKKPINLKNKNSGSKNGSLILNEKKSGFGNFSYFNLNKNSSKKKLNSISLMNSVNKTSINSSLNSSASSKNIHSYLKKTAITKHREKETKEKKIKLEKEFQSIDAQKEREGLELKKKKIIEDKQIFIKKIKEDKIKQKEKEKNKKEEEIKKAKNKYEKIKKEKEEIDREIKIEKEKEQKNKLINKQNEKEKINKMKEKLNKEREKEIENLKIKKEKEKEREKEREKEKEKLKEEKGKEIEKDREKYKEEKLLKEKEQEEKNKQLQLKIKTNKEKKLSKKESLDINNNKLENNSVLLKSKSSLRLQKEKINKNVIKEKEEEIEEEIDKKEEMENEKELELINKIAKKEEIKNKYIKNPNIYRCLKCNLIPKININEYNQEIEIYCDKFYYDNLHHNIVNYKTFQLKNLNNSIKDTILCNYCNKSLNQLENQNMLFYCPICKLYCCVDDEINHKNHKHQNDIELKNKYKSIFELNNRINKNLNLANASLNRRGSIKINSNINLNNISNFRSTRRLSLKNNALRNKIYTKIKDIKEIKNTENTKDNIKDNKENENSKNLETTEKFPIYLMDTYCFIHDEVFNCYCHDCHKNICNICQNKEHEKHLIEKFDDILLNDEELNKKKMELNNVKDNLLKINDYFMALIEAIKVRFEKLYKAKQKEIEIKEKIIFDYETIKYNYNCIQNIKNLNINNKQSYINSTNNTDWFNRLNLIFEYLNSSIISSNNDLFNSINNLSNNVKLFDYKNEKIKNIINLSNDDFCISNTNGELKIFGYEDEFKEKLNIKVFDDGYGINNIMKLDNGIIGCCGYEKIKFVDLDLYNESYSINKIIEEKNNNFYSLISFNTKHFISSGSSKKLQLWKNLQNKYIKNNIYVNEQIKDNEEINMLYKICPYSFICCSYTNKKILKYDVKKNYEIKYISKLENISVVKGDNSILNLPKYKNILLICYKNDIKDYGIKIVDYNKLEIISDFKNINPFCYINIFDNENIISINKKGIIQKWKYVENDKKLYECDKINEPFINEKNLTHNKKLKSIISMNNSNGFVFQYKNEIACIYKCE